MLHRAQFGIAGLIQFVVITLVSAVILSYCNVNLSALRTGIFKSFARTFTSTNRSISEIPNMSSSPTNWKQALDSLPSTPEKIPAFFFAHGSPMLAFPASTAGAAGGGMMAYHGPNGPLAKFLADFGPILLKKYKPKGIVVFSAHWETRGERLVSDYGDNPLLMDYYGFQPELYKLKFKSRGDSKLAARVVELYKQAGLKARTTPATESRGHDGRGFEGPGLDHGVFVPFRIMFGEEFTDIPIVEVSIDSSLDPKTNWEVGKAVSKLREEGILILAGGLTAHNLGDRTSFAPDTARAVHKEFDRAIHTAFAIESPEERKKALFALPKHPGFRASQPREDHFVPLYVAGGAGEDGEAKTIVDLYGLASFAFGI